jgi:hypothetical protein
VTRTGKWAALSFYALVSFLFFGFFGNYSRFYFGDGNDPLMVVWFLRWWPWAVSHGVDPLFTHLVWQPAGFNLTWATSVPAAALVGLPITLAKNAVLTFNVLQLLAPALAAWTAFLLCRRLSGDGLAALIGGFLFGFSTYELGELLGHLNLDLVCLVPAMLLLSVNRVTERVSRRRFVAMMALALLLQFGISVEIFASFCLFGAIAWVLFLLAAEATERVRLWHLATEVFLAFIIAAIVASPWLFTMFFRASDAPRQLNSPLLYSSDFLNFIIPTPVTRLGRSVFATISARFSGNESEQGAYLGAPLIMILILYLGERRHDRRALALLGVLVVAAVASLGPVLRVNGVDTGIPMPWSLFLHAPLIRSALPGRFALYVSLASAVAATQWIASARRARGRGTRVALGVVACLFLVPNRGLFRWREVPTLAFFRPANVEAVLGRNANVIVLPFGWTGPGMTWQWQSGMRFTQSGGYVGFTPVSFDVPLVRALFANRPTPDFANALAAFAATHHVTFVLAGPGTAPALRDALDALGWPARTIDAVRVIRVPPLRTLRFAYVRGDIWPPFDHWNWIGARLVLVTHGRPMAVALTAKEVPGAVGPVRLAVASATGSRIFVLQPGSAAILRLDVPTDGTLTITADRTWSADRIGHNGDARRFSVQIGFDGTPPAIPEQ